MFAIVVLKTNRPICFIGQELLADMAVDLASQPKGTTLKFKVPELELEGALETEGKHAVLGSFGGQVFHLVLDWSSQTVRTSFIVDVARRRQAMNALFN